MSAYKKDNRTREIEFPREESLTVDIYGQKFPVRGKIDPDFINRIADYVNEKMMEVGANMPSAAALDKIAIMAALNIAGELFQLRSEYESAESDIRDQSETLINLIDETLKT